MFIRRLQSTAFLRLVGNKETIFEMNTKLLCVLILIFIVIIFLQKKYTKTWVRIQLPMNIVASGLSLFIIVITVAGTYQVIASDMNTTGKALFVLLSVVFIAAFVWANYRFWCEWLRKYKSDE